MTGPISGIQVEPGDQFEEVVDNQPTGLAGTIGVRVIDNAGATVDPRRTSGITEQVAGSGIYVVVLTGPAAPGQYSIIWDTDPGGVLTPENTTIHSLTVIPSGVAAIASSTICELWFDPDDLTCDGGAAYATVACELLYALSGYRFPGLCQSTVRPCVPWWCGCDEPGCTACQAPWNTARLFQPLVSVEEVVIDGSVLDASTYRVYDHTYLQRIDGQGWPYQNLAVAPGLPGSWEVTFTHGAAPPALGVLAAQAFACYLASIGINGEDCTLPAHVQSLNRQGINQVFDPRVTVGLELQPVSLFLGGYGSWATDVWSPDLPPYPSEVL